MNKQETEDMLNNLVQEYLQEIENWSGFEDPDYNEQDTRKDFIQYISNIDPAIDLATVGESPAPLDPTTGDERDTSIDRRVSKELNFHNVYGMTPERLKRSRER